MSLSDRLAEIFTLKYFEDKSWGLVETLHIDGFFYDHNIPPQLFVIALIAVAIIALFIMFPPPPTKESCGNGVCSNLESPVICPLDCTTARDVAVYVKPSAEADNYTITIRNGEGKLIGRDVVEAGESSFFNNVEAAAVYVVPSDDQVERLVAGVDVLSQAAGRNITIPEADNQEDQDSPADNTLLVFPDDFKAEEESQLPIWAAEACLKEYLEEGATFENAYYEYLYDIITGLNETGLLPEGLNPACADLNGDEAITVEDLMCLTGVADGTFLSLRDCLDCDHWFPEEVCNDGMDNDCDGQQDTDTYDEETGTHYETAEGEVVDLCVCSPLTPCGTMDSLTGIPGLNYEQLVERCASINSGDYEWQLFEERNCTQERLGWNLECHRGEDFICSEKLGVFLWLGEGNRTYTRDEAIALLAALVEDAMFWPEASDNWTLSSRYNITVGAILEKLDNVASLEFVCSGGCEGLEVESNLIIALEDALAEFTANCDWSGSTGDYNCHIKVITSRGEETDIVSELASLVEGAQSGSPASSIISLSDGDEVSAAQVLAQLANVASLVFSCSGECGGIDVSSGTILIAEQDISLVFTAECAQSGASGDYYCEITV